MVELSTRDFGAYFEAIHGHAPFPWQARLLETVVSEGGWPKLLDLPTGSGKTATIDVALFHLALDAEQSPRERKAPRRIVMVVDRRTVVDQAFERAKKIARALATSASDGNGVVARVAARLRSLSEAGAPIALAQLRGGMPRDDAWAKWPDQPLVAVSTVDQVGSRLLFRGYGVSEAMRPIHAGLLGNDTLLLLDEVHLSEPFRQTLGYVSRYQGWADAGLPRRWQVVELSATPGNPGDFALDANDRANEMLAARLAATKLVELAEPVKGSGSEAQKRGAFARACAEHAARFATPGRAVGVVVNRVATAREIALELEGALARNMPNGTQVFLVTGRMRPLDRDDLDADLRERVSAGRARDAGAAPVIVVSTQCIEAGADFDFDALVTECAALDALRQRFGRLNRLGDIDDARAVVLVRADALSKDAEDPIYGRALADTWTWLGEEARDFGLDAMAPALTELSQRADENQSEGSNGLRARLTPKLDAPVMLPAHLDLWAQTKPLPEPDPDVALWLHGIGEKQAPEVQIVWRADVSEALLEAARPATNAADRRGREGAATGRAKAAHDAILARLQVCPPVGLEALSVPLHAARAWLRGEEAGDLADVEADSRSKKDKEREDERRGREARRERLAVLWEGEESRVIGPDDRALRPGSTLVVPGSYGGLAARKAGEAPRGTWDPTCKDPIPDLGDRARWQQTRRPVLRLHPGVVDHRVGAREPASREHSDDPDAEDREAALAGLKEMTAALAPDRWLHGARIAFEERRKKRPEILRLDAVSIEDEQGRTRVEPGYLAMVSRVSVRGGEPWQLAGGNATTEGDDGSHTGVEVPLRAHLRGVADLARELAASCGLPPRVARSVETAALWHDAGKVDPRFQRMLRGGTEARAALGEPLAKSRIVAESRAARRLAAERSGYPKGARHELSSVALLCGQPSLLGEDVDADLVLHLIASHHGWCRPFAPVVNDESPVDMELETETVLLRANSDHGLERLDSGVAERFWALSERYGWFGLAWLEAILRLADHRRSENEVDAASKEDR